jgi:hypothetical protein
MDAATCSSRSEACGVTVATTEGEAVLEIPANLTSKTLLSALEPHAANAKVLVFRFDGLETWSDAFGGFSCPETAEKFDARMDKILQPWCCRSPEEAEKLNTTEAIHLHMTTGRKYSFMPVPGSAAECD